MTEYGGSGLGLTIAKALVEKMGGKLEILSKKDVGTTIRFKIEFERCNDTFVEEIIEANSFNFQKPTENSTNNIKENAEDSERSKIDNSEFSVLIVEDNDLNVSVLKHFIMKVNKNLKPYVARDGVVGLEFYKKLHFQFIFMDLVCFFFIM